jgi:uncharacterized protein YkwD
MTSQIPRLGTLVLAGAVALLLGAPAASWAGRKSCVVGTEPEVVGDVGDIAALKAQIDTICKCEDYDGSGPGKKHGHFVKCAKEQIVAAVAGNSLRRQCKGTVIKIYAKSTCGFPPPRDPAKTKVPCVKHITAKDKVICAVKPQSKCTDKAGRYTQRACGGFEFCVDAGDDNGNFLFLRDPTGGDDGLCTGCDNGTCDPFEDFRNCPEDCPAPACMDPGAWPSGWTQFEDEVLLLVNAARAAGADCRTQGVFGPAASVILNAGLQAAARCHSTDMAIQDFYSHTGSNGSSFDERIFDAGYTGSFPLGENIAAGYPTPSDVVTGWLNSDTHCANIMDPDFEQLGTGYYDDLADTFRPPYRHYWTQNFGGSP